MSSAPKPPAALIHMLLCPYLVTGLQEYLSEVRRELGCKEIIYVSLNKESHVLEVPDTKKVSRCSRSLTA